MLKSESTGDMLCGVAFGGRDAIGTLIGMNVHVGNKKAQYGCDFFVIVFIWTNKSIFDCNVRFIFALHKFKQRKWK